MYKIQFMIDEFEKNGEDCWFFESDDFGFENIDLYIERVFVNKENTIRNYNFEIIC